jgi:class 3 adenylate cyclase/urease gamma subunit
MNSDIEILNSKINSAEHITTDVVDAINALAALQAEIDAFTAELTAQKALTAARSIQYNKGEATALIQAALLAGKQRNYALAEEFYELALGILERMNDKEGVAEVQKKLGNVKYYTGRYPEAIRHYSRAIELRMMLGDELGTADLYTNSGAIYGLLGNYPQALKSHLQALKIFERYKEQARIAASCANIGVVYYEQHNYDDALGMYKKALDIRLQANNEREVGVLKNNIGLVYHDQGKYAEARNMHEQVLELAHKLQDKSKIATSLSNLGDVFKAVNQLSVALSHYSSALVLFEELNNKRGLVATYFNIGELHFMLGNEAEAGEYLRKSINLAEEVGVKDHLREAYGHMAKICAQQQNYEEAYRLHLRVTDLDKEISSAETSRIMAQMSMRHEIEQKERESELQRIKNEELTKAYNSLEQEKQRSEELLLNILPEEVSAELKQFGKTKARSFDMATVLFADIKGFTIISEQLSAEELVTGIDEYFEAFDRIVEKNGIEKIKTIGDAYLCVGGVPVADPQHACKVVQAAREFLQAAESLKQKRTAQNLPAFDFRIGVHSGPVVAGVVGIKKFAYDIWGDTVNTASRMQQNSEPGRINISDSTYQLLQDKFICDYRGELEAKNKGMLKMYFVK